MSLHLRGNKDRVEFYQSRSDVDEPNFSGYPLRSRMGFRESYYEWDVDGLVIEEDAVGFFAVSAEALALARCDDNGGGGVELLLVQNCQEFTDGRIGCRDSGVVGRSGRVRIDLNPEEEWGLCNVGQQSRGNGPYVNRA